MSAPQTPLSDARLREEGEALSKLRANKIEGDHSEALAARSVPDGWRDVGYLMSIIDAAIEDGFDPDADGPSLDEIRAELKASSALAAAPSIASTERAGAAEGVLRDLDYLIDDVVADAYVWGAEGRGTEISPQSAKTLHDAIATALATHPVTVAEGEPVAWLHETEWGDKQVSFEKAVNPQWNDVPLYRASPIQSEVGVKPLAPSALELLRRLSSATDRDAASSVMRDRAADLNVLLREGLVEFDSLGTIGTPFFCATEAGLSLARRTQP